jgi:hypothetical protein
VCRGLCASVMLCRAARRLCVRLLSSRIDMYGDGLFVNDDVSARQPPAVWNDVYPRRLCLLRRRFSLRTGEHLLRHRSLLPRGQSLLRRGVLPGRRSLLPRCNSMLSSVKPVLRLRVLSDRDDVLRGGMLPGRDNLPERWVCAECIGYPEHTVPAGSRHRARIVAAHLHRRSDGAGEYAAADAQITLSRGGRVAEALPPFFKPTYGRSPRSRPHVSEIIPLTSTPPALRTFLAYATITA